MSAQFHDDRYLAESAREMVKSFRAQRFQHVVALFDQLLRRQVGTTPAELLEQLAEAGGKGLQSVLARSYSYDSCWFCDSGMAGCDRCGGNGQVDEGLFCMDCHGLGKSRCTVCRGSSFVILEEIPEFFREAVVAERLNLAERAFAGLVRDWERSKSESERSGAAVRGQHHRNQQILGVLHDCHAYVSRQPAGEQATKFNSLVRGVQDGYHRLSEQCARLSLEAARRLSEGDHAEADGARVTRLSRSIEHNLAIAQGYIEILNRAGIRKPGESMAFDIREIEQRLRNEESARMVVPVGTAAQPVPAARPRRRRPGLVTEFVEELDEGQIEEVWLLFREEWWGRERTLGQTQGMVAGSGVNLAMLRPEGREKHVAGYVRAVTDGVLKAVIYDFVVAREHRGTGLGKLLMKRLLSHRMLREVQDVELYCMPEMIDMFKQWGFSENVAGTVHLRYLRP